MKNLTLLFYCFFCFFIKTSAQNQNIKSDDYNRLALNIFIPDQVERIPFISSELLKDKITMLLSKNGLTGNNAGGRFIVAPIINVLSKEITPTAPAMTVVELEFSLYIGDGYEGIKFSSTSFTAKGVGQNLTKAYIDAIKKLNVNDPSIPSFVEMGKNKIIEYYNSKCDFILSDAKKFSDQNNFDEALYKLNSIPEVCKECYAKASRLAVEYYLKAQERDCKIKLQQAENIWSANPTEQGAQEAASLLNQIDPETSCYSKAKILINSINKTITTKIENIEAFNRKLVLLNKSNNFELEKARIGAVRDIAVAYANNRPKTIVYNVVGWW